MEQITCDLIPGGKMPLLHASQYDEGREYRINLTENKQAYTLDGTELLTVSVRKGDNTLFTADVGNVFSGKSYVDFVSTEQMCAVAGYNYGELTIEKNNTRIGTVNFMLVCEPSPEADFPSDSEIKNLNRRIDDHIDEVLPDMVEEVAPAIVEEVATPIINEQVPAKVEEVAPAIVEEVAEPIVERLVPEVVGNNYYNKTQTDDLLAKKANEIINYNDTHSFERGFVSTSGGAIGYNTKRARTELIDIVQNELNDKLFFTCNAPSTIYTFKVCAFYKDGVFVKNLQSSSYSASGTEVSLDGTFNQFRLCFSLVDDTQDMTDAQVEALSTTIKTDVTLSTTKGDVDSNTERIKELENIDYSDIILNTVIPYNRTYPFERGFVSTSGGAIGYNTKRARTELIDIVQNELNDKLFFTCNAPSTIYTFKVCAFYKDGVFVKNLQSSSYSASGTEVSLDGTFNQFRLCFSLKNDTQDMTDEQVAALSTTITTNITLSTTKGDLDNNTERIEVLEENEKIPNLWYKGKKCVAIGDSITYGYAPRNYELFGQQLDSYAKLAASRMGMSFVNYGIAGSTVAYHVSRDPMSERYTSMDNDADVILFMGGTNDIRSGISLGTMADRTNTTFYGALHVLFGGLYKKYMIDQGVEVGKTKKIVICTPIKLLQTGSEESGGTGTLVDFGAWIDAIKEVANYYSFPVLDFYNQSNINPHLNETIAGTAEGYIGYYYNPYITDGTHPTQEGQDIMADVLCGYLMSLVS